MQQASSAFSTSVPALAAIPQLAGNSRQGFGLAGSTMRWASDWVISSTALGIKGSLYDGDAGSRSTGKERDTESGLDYFGARYLASDLGRWMTPDPKHWTANHLISPQKWNKYNYVQNNPLLRFDPNGMDDYVVFRTVTAGTNGAAWSAAEKSITSQKDSHGNYNTFHMVEGNNATVGAFNKALSTPGTHVVFVGHTVHEPGKTTPYGVGLSNGESSGKNGSTTVGMTETPSATPGEPPSLSMSIDATSSASVSASSVALFGCNSYDLASQYSGTDFTGVQSGANGTEAETLDSAAAAWVGAGGGQAGDTAANGAIDASQYPVDTGDNVESEQPATNPNDNASAPPHSN